MRTLVDLNSRVVVITWWEKSVFPDNANIRYDGLKARKYQWREELTEEEEKELEHLRTVEGEITIRVDSIEIISNATIDIQNVPVSFILLGNELIAINKEIEKLKDQYKGRKIPMEGTIEEYEDLPY